MVVYMDYERIRNIASRFRSYADVIRAVDTAFEIAANTVRVTAFIGLVGGIFLERYIAEIRPQLLQIADYCEETAIDIDKAVQHYVNADAEGSSRFF